MIKRHPIIYRVPIFVQRTAVFPRKPLCCRKVKWEHCKLCSEYNDCSGKLYVDIEDNSSDFMRSVYVSSLFSDWENLENQIWGAHHNGAIVRLITDVDLPKEIVWALSYSEKNILQLNLNMAHLNRNIGWIDSLVSLANRCGLYCVICMHPIIPEVTRTFHVISVLDRLRGYGCFHVSLKFWEIHERLTESDGWLNFNGVPVDIKYLERTQDGWKCNDSFKQNFYHMIKAFSVPHKLSVSLCGDETDCTGLTKAKTKEEHNEDWD